MFEFLTILLVALRDFPYAGQEVLAGQTFLATPDDAKYFKLHGRARDATVQESEAFTRPVPEQVQQPVPVVQQTAASTVAEAESNGPESTIDSEASDKASDTGDAGDAQTGSTDAAGEPASGAPDAPSAQQDLVLTAAGAAGATVAAEAAAQTTRRGPGRPARATAAKP